VVETQNDVEDKWLEYKTDGGEAQAKEIKAALLAEKRNELLQEKLYVPTGKSITQQIRELEDGWSMHPESDSRHCEMTEKIYYEDDKYYTKAIERTYLEYLQKCGE